MWDNESSIGPEDVAGIETLAFLATDIEDSTPMWEHEPELMRTALERHDAILREAIDDQQGSIFKGTGDGVMAVFGDLAAAAAAAVAIQHRLANEKWATTNAIRVRAAVDSGPVQHRDGDYYGPVVNQVVRIMSSGHGGQLLVHAHVAAGTQQPTRSLGVADYKGIGRLEVHQIVVDGLEPEHPPLATERTPKIPTRPGFSRTIRGYELLEELRGGENSIVYRAYQTSVGREVAVKIIRPDFANDAGFVRRFEAEAQFVAQLEYPHIVSLYDYWRDPDGAYLVMNYLRGGSLANALERATFNPPAALRLLEQVGGALAYAHRHGVVHGDIKPGNVLLDDDGNAYLSDFGIAHQGAGAATGAQTTSVAYVSPEELAGAPVDARSDIYCLGLLANELLTGERPAFGGEPSVTHELRPDLGPEVSAVIARAADADPERRYQRADDFLDALRPVLGAGGTTMRSVAAEPAGEIRNPFKGLRAFGEVDAQDFFGRDALVDELLETLRTSNFVAAVGPSGSGKSSVVKAGVLPAVREGGVGPGDWLVAEMFPGTFPFEELEAALLRVAVMRPPDLLGELERDDRGLLRVSKQILRDDTSLLLVIDQFEELFSLVADEAVRAQFLDNLVTAARDARSRLKVVVTMRADFFDRPLVHPAFGELLKSGLVAVTMPSDDNLALAISRPAQNAGLELEPGLVSALVSEVRGQPGGLPLLQYALTELVDARSGRTLTLDAYRSSGGALGALGRRAEDIYGELGAEGREAARELFLRLVNVDGEGEDTRRRVRRTELASLSLDSAALEQAIGEYGSYRLLSFDHDPVTRGPTVEVAHEALIRQWPRYRDWVDDLRKDLLLSRRLTTLATEWDDGSRDESFLIQGNRLDQFEAWHETSPLATTETESAFLDASLQLGRSNEESERRTVRRTKILAMASTLLAVVALLALIATLLALQSARRSERDARAAETTAIEATARALIPTNPALALAMAAEADVRGSSLSTRSALMATRAGFNGRSGLARKTLVGHESGVRSVSFSPDGAVVATASYDETAKLWDVATGLEVATLTGGQGRVLDVRYSQDGSLIATGNDDMTAIVWDAVTLEPRLTLAGHTNQVWSVGFSPDGSRLATASTDGTVRVWDTTTGETVLTSDGHEGGVLAVDFSPDGTTYASGSRDGTARVWSATTGEQLVVFDGFGGPVRDVVYSEDGATLATANPDGSVGVWDVASGEAVTSIAAHSGALWGVAISKQGLVGTASVDGTARVWDPNSGALLADLTEHESAVFGIAFHPDGRLVATSSLDGSAKLSVPQPPAAIVELNGHDGWVVGAIFDPTGRWVATTSRDGTVRLWDVETGALRSALVGHEGWVLGAAFSPDGSLLASAGDDASVRLWNVETGAEISHIVVHDDQVRSVAFDSSGRRLVSGSRDKTSVLIDVETGTELMRFQGHEDGIRGVAVSADDRLLATASGDGTAKIWDMATGEDLLTLEGHSGFVRRAAFHPDSGTLATAGFDGSTRIWDATSGELLDVLRPNAGVIFEVTYSRDGSMLATATQDGSVKLWDTATGSLLVSILSHDGSVRGMDFSPDGDWLVTGGEDQRALLHPIAISAGRACELAGEYISEAQLVRELGDAEIRACTDLDG